LKYTVSNGSTGQVKDSADGARAYSLRPRDRLGLSAHYFFSFASLGFSFTFLPLFLRDRGLSFTEIGGLNAVYALAGASTQIPFGMLSDKLGRRKPIAIASALALGAIYLALGRVQTYAGFCLIYLIAGVLFFTVATLTNALISDWTAGTRATGRNFGITRIWGSLGFVTALVLVAVMPRISLGSSLLPAIAVLHWISGLCISTVTEPERHARAPQPFFRAMPRLLGNANLSVFLLTFLLYRIAENGGINFLSLYLRELHGSRSLIALAYALNAVVEIPFMIWVGVASDRIGRRPPLVIAFTVLPVRLFLYSQLTSPEQVFFVQMLHGLTFSFMLVSSLAFMADQSPDELRATGQGLLNMVAATAMALGPFLGGLLADRASISAMYMALAVVALIAGLVFILVVHESHPDFSHERLALRLSASRRLLRPVVRLLSSPLLRLPRLGSPPE